MAKSKRGKQKFYFLCCLSKRICFCVGVMMIQQLEALKLAVDKKSLKEKRKLREKLKKLRFQRQMSLGAFDAVDEDPELFSLKCSKALQEEDTVMLFFHLRSRLLLCRALLNALMV